MMSLTFAGSVVVISGVFITGCCANDVASDIPSPDPRPDQGITDLAKQIQHCPDYLDSLTLTGEGKQTHRDVILACYAEVARRKTVDIREAILRNRGEWTEHFYKYYVLTKYLCAFPERADTIHVTAPGRASDEQENSMWPLGLDEHGRICLKESPNSYYIGADFDALRFFDYAVRIYGRR